MNTNLYKNDTKSKDRIPYLNKYRTKIPLSQIMYLC